MDTKHGNIRPLSPYLTPLGAWALSLGAAIGWGSLVVTNNSYLLQAGPWGSALGLLVGAAVMVVIARNYHYLVNCFPDAGGAYTFTKEIFGHDFGFLTSWFLSLTYISILWANATSLPLFAKYFLGDFFHVGYLYTVFGYDVYLGEALLTIAAVCLVALACMRSRRAVMMTMIVLALLFTVGIAACFASALAGIAMQPRELGPAFLPDRSAISQVALIACASPWAFIGFEGLSHSAEEFAFPRDKTFRIMVAAIVTATALYAFVMFLSTMAYSPEYDSWLAYISDHGNLEGIKGLPAFYAAYSYLGDAGVAVLMLALLALVLTSLVANIVALSRLFLALARDSVLPRSLATVGRHATPARAILLIAALSLLIPFLGRTAVGWIVDVTTIGATVIYGFVSAAAYKVSRARGDATERVTGMLGVVFAIVVGAYLIVPSLFLSRSLEPESFFLFAAWGILGFIFFRFLLSRDESRRFGRSVIVWLGLLLLVVVVSFIWMNQSLADASRQATVEIEQHYEAEGATDGGQLADRDFVEGQIAALERTNSTTLAIAAVLLGLAIALLLANFSHMSRWAQESEKERDLTLDILHTDPLTGLPSLTRFRELSDTETKRIAAEGRTPVVVAFGITGMKEYISEHGREGRDNVLRAFAGVLRAHFGENACSRFSDDHFFAIAAQDGLEAKLEDVFADFESAEGGALPLRAGLCAYSPNDDTATAFDRARAARDLDSKTWRSRFTWFSDTMDDDAKLRLRVLDQMNRAVSERWIRPFYQPIVDPVTHEVRCEEALARWIDPEFGPLSPGIFIPVLEEAGVLHTVDMHMVDCVLEDLSVKAEHGVALVPVSVNISLRDLEQLDVANQIVERVNRAGVPHDLLRVEFTESAASEDPSALRDALDILHSAGFEVWMDDFGSGFSSLNSLKDFDFDLLKLDMDFLRDEGNPKTWDIISGVVRIARDIGMGTLAEGVETDVQVRHLEEIGCDLLQGYRFSRPLPLDEVIAQQQDGSGLTRPSSRFHTDRR